jgi:hypothetical protein
MTHLTTVGIIAALTAVFVAACAPAGPQPSRTAAPTPTPDAQSPMPTASPPQASTTDAVAFSSALHGLEVGSICASTCTIRVAITDTAGTTWGPSLAVATLPVSDGTSPIAALGVRFQGDNAWIFGPNVYESHDDGHTWRQTLSGPVLALEPYENEVWAVTGCSGQDSTGCRPRLMLSAAASDAWSLASTQPDLALSIAAASAPFVVMERAPHGVTFLAQNTVPPPAQTGGQAVSPEGQLLFTSNNLGRSWQRLHAPCSGIQSVRSTDGVHVWVLCSVPCCTGNYVKSLWTSADGGHSWTERSGTDPQQTGSIPFSGSAQALTVTPAGVGVFGGSSSGGIWRSSDSGATWRQAWTDECIEGGNAVSETWFATPLDGWAVTGDTADPRCPTLLHSIDGGVTWSGLPSPF